MWGGGGERVFPYISDRYTIRVNQTKIDTLFKAQTQKMTPYARETKAQNSFVLIQHEFEGGEGVARYSAGTV